MKTKEFIKRVEELGYKTNLRTSFIQIMHNDFVAVAVYMDKMYAITFNQIIKTSWNNADKLFDLVVQYAKTPIEDREEENKYYLKHKFLISSTEGARYEDSFLNYNTRNNEMYLSDKMPVGDIRTKFTLKEIEEIKEKFDTDLKDFELVEVENDPKTN